jgi:hypothetical protein
MNERIKKLIELAGISVRGYYDETGSTPLELQKFAELIVRECMDQVEQAKNSHFVSLDDAKRMAHFVNVTKKKVQKHFGVEE